jgi:hypothetical protein
MKHRYIILLLITSCSFIDETIYSIDPEIDPYYQRFLQEGINRGQDYSNHHTIIYFYGLDVAGRTIKKRSDGVIEIVIDKHTWDINPDIIREVILFHELGHGVLNRDHSDDVNSLMSTNNGDIYRYYKENKKIVLDELFN